MQRAAVHSAARARQVRMAGAGRRLGIAFGNTRARNKVRVQCAGAAVRRSIGARAARAEGTLSSSGRRARQAGTLLAGKVH